MKQRERAGDDIPCSSISSCDTSESSPSDGYLKVCLSLAPAMMIGF